MSEKDTPPKEASDIRDMRDDKSSNAHVHVEQQIDGIVVKNSSPPRSIASHQEDLNGYDPFKYFDEENAEKRVEGVSSRTGNILETRQDKIDDWQEGKSNIIGIGDMSKEHMEDEYLEWVARYEDLADEYYDSPYLPDREQDNEQDQDDGQER